MIEIPINKFFPIEDRDWKKIKIHGLWVEFISIESTRGIIKISEEYYESLNPKDKDNILRMIFTPWYYKQYSQFKIVRDNNIETYNEIKSKVGLMLGELDNLGDEDLKLHFTLTYELSLYEINQSDILSKNKLLDMISDTLSDILARTVVIKSEKELYKYLGEEWDMMKERLI